MSLRVWLPLTKDLRNQGLDDVTVTNNGATFNSAGKLGGCYSFNASGYLKETSFDWTNFNTSEFSLCCWYKEPSPVASGNSQMICIGTSSGWNNIRIGLLRRTSNGYPMFSVSDGTNNVNYNFTADSFALDAWNHIVCTYNNGTMKMYLNGVLHKTSTTTIVPVLNSSQHLGIGAASNGSEPLTGYLNDVRIYDHCLSPMEVKELAKGLVLHYPLNHSGFGQENFILESHQVTSGSQAAGITRTYEDDGTVKFVAASGNSNYATVFFAKDSKANVGEKLSVGDVYTISCDIKVEAGNKLPTLFINGGNGYKQLQGTIILGKWIRAYYTSTWAEPGTQYGNITLHLGFANAIGTYYFKNFKLEKSSVPTPWTPAPTDELYTILGLNSNIEYDTSGYCNNGIRTGTFSWTSDTPKYSVSTHIGSTSSKIHISDFPTSGFGNSYSFAWWGKRNNNAPMFWGFENGIRLNGMYQGNLWNTGDGSENPIYKPGTTTTITVPTLNVWHHYVMTGDGTTCKLYLDGELYGQTKTYKAISGTSLWINGWNSATSYASNNTDMSDFRIYATALSADDVKSLYQNSAYIDSSGNVYGTIHES